jgi:hypothetical protein
MAEAAIAHTRVRTSGPCRPIFSALRDPLSPRLADAAVVAVEPTSYRQLAQPMKEVLDEALPLH